MSKFIITCDTPHMLYNYKKVIASKCLFKIRASDKFTVHKTSSISRQLFVMPTGSQFIVLSGERWKRQTSLCRTWCGLWRILLKSRLSHWTPTKPYNQPVSAVCVCVSKPTSGSAIAEVPRDARNQLISLTSATLKQPTTSNLSSHIDPHTSEAHW